MVYDSYFFFFIPYDTIVHNVTTLWKFKIAIEHGTIVVDLPIKWWLSIAMPVYQRVCFMNIQFTGFINKIIPAGQGHCGKWYSHESPWAVTCYSMVLYMHIYTYRYDIYIEYINVHQKCKVYDWYMLHGVFISTVCLCIYTYTHMYSMYILCYNYNHYTFWIEIFIDTREPGMLHRILQRLCGKKEARWTPNFRPCMLQWEHHCSFLVGKHMGRRKKRKKW